jgi:hypothetical protein
MSKRQDKLNQVADVLQRLFENGKSPLSDGFQRYRLEQKWPQVVGAQLAKYTRPVDYNRGLLTIAVTNASLLTELRFFQDEIITKVNTHLDQVWTTKLHFTSE